MSLITANVKFKDNYVRQLLGLLHAVMTIKPTDSGSFCVNKPELADCSSCAISQHERKLAALRQAGWATTFDPIFGGALKIDSSLFDLFLLSFAVTTNNHCYHRAISLARLWRHYGVTDDCQCQTVVGTVKFYNAACVPYRAEPGEKNNILVNNRPGCVESLRIDPNGYVDGIHHGWVERREKNGETWCYDTSSGYRIRKEEYYRLYEITDAQVGVTVFPDNYTPLEPERARYLVQLMAICMLFAAIPFDPLYGDLGWKVYRALLGAVAPNEDTELLQKLFSKSALEPIYAHVFAACRGEWDDDELRSYFSGDRTGGYYERLCDGISNLAWFNEVFL